MRSIAKDIVANDDGKRECTVVLACLELVCVGKKKKRKGREKEGTEPPAFFSNYVLEITKGL